MSLPEGLITIEVTGTYLDAEGIPRSGEVAFSIPQPLKDITGRVVLMPTTIRAELDTNGHFSLTLPVTDDIRIDPPSWYYTITERIDQYSTRVYSARIPQDFGTTVDITQLMPVATPDQATDIVLDVDGRSGHVLLGDSYAALNDAGVVDAAQLPAPPVTQVQGKVGDVTLAPGDIGALPSNQKNAPGGVPSLDGEGKISASQDRVLSVDGHTGDVVLDYASSAQIDSKIAAHVAAVDPHQDRAYSDTNLTAHSRTTDPHGDRAFASNALDAHVSASDPHGDRADAAAKYVPLTQRGAANGIATLGAAGTIPTGQIPDLPYGRTYFVASEADMLALTAKLGDVAVRSDSGQTFMLIGTPTSDLANWFNMNTVPPVTSVNGQVGDVALDAADIGAVATTARGAANGVASLDGSSLVPIAQIPSLPPTTISGTLDPAQIPSLDAAKITSGVFTATQIPDLDAAKIVSGTVSFPRLPTGTSGTTVATGDHTHSTYVSTSQIGAANGVASLGADGKIPSTELSAAVTSVNGQSGDVVLSPDDVNAVGTSSLGAPGGVATLDDAGHVPDVQLPGYVSSINGGTGDVTVSPDSIGAVATTAVGAANGIASLDVSGKVPLAQMADLGSTYLSTAEINAANGVAGLDASALLSTTQIPSLPATIIGTGTFDAARIPDLSATYLPVAQKGAASGLAPLNASTKLATSYLETNTANGVAGLDASGKIAAAQALVASVAGKTGTVTLSASDVNALPTNAAGTVNLPDTTTGVGTVAPGVVINVGGASNDPNDVFTQAFRINVPADISSTITRSNVDGGKGIGNGAADTWGVYFNGNPTGYGNELGELRSNAGKTSTIAFRAKAFAGTNDGRKIIDATDSAGAAQGAIHNGGLLTLKQRSTAAPTDGLALPTGNQQIYTKTDSMVYAQSSAGERQLATTIELKDTLTQSGGTLTVSDVTVATMHAVTLAASITTLTLPTAAAGKSMLLALTQGGAGGYTVTWPSTVKWAGGAAPTLSITAGKVDVISLICVDGTNWLAFPAGLDMR